MPRVPKFEVNKHPTKGWDLNIPASVSETGKRRRLYFGRRQDATDEAEKRKREIQAYGQRSLHIAPGLAVEAERCNERLKPYGVSLTAAVSEWMARQDSLSASESVEDAFVHYLRRKDDEGRTDHYMRDLQSAQRRLPNWFLRMILAAVEVADVERALGESAKGPTSYNNTRRMVAAVFNESVRRGKAPSNVVTRTLKKKSPPKPIDILSLAESKAMLAACKNHPDMKLDCSDSVPAVALALFAGIRPSADQGELTKLDWSAIDLEDRIIRFSPEGTKTRRHRFIKIEDNLAAWLTPFAKKSGRVIPPNWRRKYSLLRKAAGLTPDRQDVTRRTYASAHLAVFNEIDALRAYMGHDSKNVLFDHFLRLMPKHDAIKYWRLAPEGVEIALRVA
jgi:integrase